LKGTNRAGATPRRGGRPRGWYDPDVSATSDTPPLLQVDDLRVRFPRRGGGWFDAVRGVSFDLHRGQTLGLVGESGSGKTTTGRAALRLIDAAAGRVTLDGTDVLGARGETLRRLRRRMQIIFQDPGGAMNPRQRVWQIVSEPLLVQGVARSRDERRRRAGDLLDRCGLGAEALDRRPHEFSGGQRQRIVIARALALEPDLVVCDEPTSALDVSVQAQILNLLRDLQRERGLAYLFISHDMGVVRHMCDRIAVMKDGAIVEAGEAERIVEAPEEPYTKRLLASVPKLRIGA
jgi:ABC-type glutathione transport system ATPase component